MTKQFVPQEVCLKCQGCCRFKEQDSVWSVCLLDEEIQNFLDKDIPPARLSLDKKLMPIPNPQGQGYICPLFDVQDNKCKIYEFRPLECQLYPFLISLRNKKVLLSVDLNCPYIKEKINTKEFKEYTDYLTNFLNSPKQLELFKDNPHIIRAYEEVLDVIELNT
jgi:Fe-S-cluster containining protein